MNLTEALNIIKTSLENTAIATVKSLKAHTFRADIGDKKFAITNWPKVQAVKGKMAVVDLEKIEQALVKIIAWQKSLEESLKSVAAKDTVKIENFPDFPAIPSFPKSTRIEGEVKVDRDSFSTVLEAIEALSQQVAKLPKKYPDVKIPPFPKIEIPSFPKIPTPPKEVSVTNLEKLISADPKRFVPVRLSDGKRFYQAIEELTVSASRAQAFSDSQGVRKQALVDEERHVQVDVLTQPGDATAAKQDEILAKFPFENYQYMGSQTSGNYVYYGFKQYKGTGWYVMRKDTTDDSAWKYAYGTSGWSTIWADPTTGSYDNPPDS